MKNLETIQLFNTAIIKNKQRGIDHSHEDKLRDVCQTPVFEALDKAAIYLSDSQKISRDQAAIEIIETINKLNSIWGEYIMIEGIDKLKKTLSLERATS